jgi:hypothetical protein
VRWMAETDLEIWESSGGIDRAHDVKADSWECAYPPFLIVTNVIMNTLVDGFVGSFTGAISFGVVCRREFKFDSSQFVKGAPEFWDKEFVSIGDDIFRQTILAVPVVEKQNSEIFGGYVGTSRYNLDVGADMICHW